MHLWKNTKTIICLRLAVIIGEYYSIINSPSANNCWMYQICSSKMVRNIKLLASMVIFVEVTMHLKKYESVPHWQIQHVHYSIMYLITPSSEVAYTRLLIVSTCSFRKDRFCLSILLRINRWGSVYLIPLKNTIIYDSLQPQIELLSI